MLTQELTLLHREDLQRDYEAKQEQRVTLERKRSELDSLQGTFRQQTFRLSQRFEPSEPLQTTRLVDYS